MAETIKTDLGKVSLTPKGAYNPETQYEPLDVVEHAGSSYLVLSTVTGVTPSEEQPAYMLLAHKGDKGDTGEQGIQGKTGPAGRDFYIKKEYPSISVMETDAGNPEVEVGQFVMITSNVEDPDNAKLYIKESNGFRYIGDLSGSQGIKGPKGDPGKDGVQIDDAKTSAEFTWSSDKINDELNGKVTTPATGLVGQAIVVKAVDSTGKPTEWECKDAGTTIEKFKDGAISKVIVGPAKPEQKSSLGVDEKGILRYKEGTSLLRADVSSLIKQVSIMADESPLTPGVELTYLTDTNELVVAFANGVSGGVVAPPPKTPDQTIEVGVDLSTHKLYVSPKAILDTITNAAEVSL